MDGEGVTRALRASLVKSTISQGTGSFVNSVGSMVSDLATSEASTAQTTAISTTDSASGSGSAREVVQPPSSLVFPFQIPLCPCLPSSWTKVQDWLHLVLICGILGSAFCAVHLAWELSHAKECYSPFCLKELISGILVLPSTIYFIQCIGAYDDQLRKKRDKCTEKVHDLIEVHNQAVADLNDTCVKLATNANSFAMRCFQDKCTAFEGFLVRVQLTEKIYANDEMLEHFKGYVIHWMEVFSGGLLTSQAAPLRDGAEREIRACSSAEEVCEKVIKRMKSSICLIQYNRQAEMPTVGEAEPPQCLVDERGLCGVSWLECGRDCGCGCDRSPTEDRMPMSLHFVCLRLRVLSRTHAHLLLFFLMNIVLMLFEVVWGRWGSLVLVLINEACIVSMLACFEQINEIALLQRQIAMFEKRSQEANKKRQAARSEWAKVQQLHEVWKLRTFPCLTIMQKVQDQLQGKDMERLDKARKEGDTAAGKEALNALDANRAEFLKMANKCLEDLEKNLGPVDKWMEASPDDPDGQRKVLVGKQLEIFEKEVHHSQVEARLPRLNDDIFQALSMIENQAPDGSPQLSPRQSIQTDSIASRGSSSAAHS